MTDAPLVSVVILTYNNPSVLKQAIESARALDYPNREIIVVDNASTDETAEMVRRTFDDVVLIVRSKNSPVAARNEGYRMARGEFVLSLDHDMILPDSRLVQRAVDVFRSFPRVGLLSVKICGEERPDDPLEEHWWYPTSMEAKDSFFYTSYFAEGAAFFRAEALRASGGYDEMFFHTAENVDLALRLLDDDWRILYCPTLSSIELVVSGHLSQRRTRSNQYSIRNRLWVAWKHYPIGRALVYVAPRIAMAAVRSVRYRWFDFFLAGLKDGVFAPAEIRSRRRPLSSERWNEISRMEGVTVDPPTGGPTRPTLR